MGWKARTAHLGVEGGHGVDAVGGCACAVLDAYGGRRVVVGADGTHLDIVRGTPSLLLALGLCARDEVVSDHFARWVETAGEGNATHPESCQPVASHERVGIW